MRFFLPASWVPAQPGASQIPSRRAVSSGQPGIGTLEDAGFLIQDLKHIQTHGPLYVSTGIVALAESRLIILVALRQRTCLLQRLSTWMRAKVFL